MRFADSPGGLFVSFAVFAGSLLFAFRGLPAPQAAPSWPGENYSETTSPFLGNEHVFSIIGFNGKGHIVGTGANGQGRFTAQFCNGGSSRDLDCLPGFLGSRAYGLNNDDVAVGSSHKKGVSYSVRPTRACRWDAGGVTELPPLPGFSCSRAWALNDKGIVVGASYTPESEARNAAMVPTVWIAGKPCLLPLPKGADQGEARRINASGVAVGTATFSDGRSIACEWKDEKLRVLPLPSGARSSTAVGINGLGAVVGLADERAVVWNDGVPIRLAEYPGAPNLSVVDIDDAGEVLLNDQASPVNQIDDDPALPLLFRPGKGYVKVSHLVPSGRRTMLVKALAINPQGRIAVGAILGGNKVVILTLSPAGQ